MRFPGAPVRDSVHQLDGPLHPALRRIGRSISGGFDRNPVVRAAKNLRNGVIDHAFRRCSAAAGHRFATAISARGVRHAAVAIAYNSPWVVDLLTQAWARHQPGLPLVVIDNSSDPAARAEHAALCRSRDVPYLPLPRNPERHPCRSHGIALNWTWFNVVRHAELEFVGFVDHDCIPVAAFDLSERMRSVDVYGMYHESITYPGAWNLWAGYCFLRPAAAAAGDVDFKHRIEFGLDTGGGNWRGFYRHLDPHRIGRATCRRVQPVLGDGGTGAPCMLLDDAFLHLEGASYRQAFRDASLRRGLAEALLDGPLVCHAAELPGRRRHDA